MAAPHFHSCSQRIAVLYMYALLLCLSVYKRTFSSAYENLLLSVYISSLTHFHDSLIGFTFYLSLWFWNKTLEVILCLKILYAPCPLCRIYICLF